MALKDALDLRLRRHKLAHRAQGHYYRPLPDFLLDITEGFDEPLFSIVRDQSTWLVVCRSWVHSKYEGDTVRYSLDEFEAALSKNATKSHGLSKIFDSENRGIWVMSTLVYTSIYSIVHFLNRPSVQSGEIDRPR